MRLTDKSKTGSWSMEIGSATSLPSSSHGNLAEGRALEGAGAREQLERAIGRIELEIREGLAHGFFELSVHCEVIQGGKRRLTIKPGKSFQFVIPEEELQKPWR